jgi:predicted metal-dependent HD superfamily phosphohydrolase
LDQRRCSLAIVFFNTIAAMAIPNPPVLEAALSKRFTTLATSLGASTIAARSWSETFIKHYTELQRHYHTLEHVGAMIRSLDECRDLICDKSAVVLAIFFHDIVYDPRGKDNEAESVKVFEDFAGSLGLAEPMTKRVTELIERTITHTLPCGEDGRVDEDMKLFLDFDLEVLSRSREEYDIYAKQIRKEYGHYKENEYRKGRLKVLQGFMERDRLYFSEKFYAENEEAARRNLRVEIAELEE